MGTGDQKNDKAPEASAEQRIIPLAKLSMPRLARGIARPRLFKMLDEGRRAAATWIAAPGGAGKTTLAATYLIERKLPHLWYQLDQDDADPATFFYYLGIAAHQALPGREIHLPLLTPEYLPDIPGFARRYFRDLYAALPRDAVLVLDNHQELDGIPLFAEILRNALEATPSGNHLLVISRADTPPAMAQHRAMGTVDWETLRLTYEETQAIVAHSHSLDEEGIRTLHRRSDGWPAGITLLLEQAAHTGRETSQLDAGSLETVFQFFASEFFNQLPQSAREFLVQTSLLANMTPRMAAAVTANDQAAEILADLHRRHFFVNRRELAEPSYQYHDLFREFLLTRVDELDPERYRQLIRRAGRELVECRRHEEAVSLYLKAGEWELAIPLLLDIAPEVIAQGRSQMIAGWLQRIPDEMVKASPWLLYWWGVSHLFFDPGAAQAALADSYEGFVAAGDALGQMLSAAAIIDIIFFLRRSLLESERWIAVLQDLIAKDVSFPSPAIEARVLSSLFSALELLRPQDPRLLRYGERLMKFLEADLDVNQRIIIAIRLMIYYATVRGDTASCEHILAIVSTLKLSDIAPATQMHWMIGAIQPGVMLGKKDGMSSRAVATLLEFVRGDNLELNLKAHNLLFLEFILRWYAVLAYLHMRDLRAVDALLARMGMMVHEPESIDMAIYTLAKAAYALEQSDLATANHFARISVQAHNSVGAMITGHHAAGILALVSYEVGDYQTASEQLESLKKLGLINLPVVHFYVLLIEAYGHLCRGDTRNCHIGLRHAFAQAEECKLPGIACWFLSIMPPLCAEALRAGIALQYVRKLIGEQDILPDDTAGDEWPWRMKIFTLGSFRLATDAHEAAPFLQPQGKPFSLLATLIALGGVNVGIDHLAEILWPDAEGDAASSAFTTTISRLRKLIGDDLLVVKGGRVSLDEQRCWVDVRALERHLARCEQVDEESSAVGAYVKRLMNLYRGCFMGDARGEWVVDRRHTLRNGVARALVRCASILRALGSQQEAAQLLEEVAKVDHTLVDHFPDLVAI